MSLVLREIKGSPLTFAEMDGNLTFLDGKQPGPVADENVFSLDFTTLFTNLAAFVAADPASPTDPLYDDWLSSYVETVVDGSNDMKGFYENEVVDQAGTDFRAIRLNGTVDFTGDILPTPMLYQYLGTEAPGIGDNVFQSLDNRTAETEINYMWQEAATGAGTDPHYTTEVYWKAGTTIIVTVIIIDWDGNGSHLQQVITPQ
jgi:hypothetical protein